MENDIRFYKNFESHTDGSGGSTNTMHETPMMDGVMYDAPTRRELAERDRAKRRETIGINNIDEAVEWAVGTTHDKRWDTGRIATSLRKPGGQINQLLQAVGVNPNKTHFEVTGAPVAWMFLIHNQEFFAQNPTRAQQEATFEEVREQYPAIAAKIEAAKPKANADGKQNGHKSKKNGRR